MKTKILIGILFVISLVVVAGIVIAHGINEKDENKNEMTEMMNMMSNTEKMMNDKEIRKEMLEHMEDCPMMGVMLRLNLSLFGLNKNQR